MLIKKELFRGPLGWLLPRLGGIPLDRDNPGGVVRELVREARSGEPFLLVLAAEGTRKKGEYWKSGFWRLARSAKLPIALGVHRRAHPHRGIRSRRITATSDVVADMDQVRAFYADKRGIHPRAAHRAPPSRGVPGRRAGRRRTDPRGYGATAAAAVASAHVSARQI